MSQVAECIQQLTTGDEAERIYAAEDIGYANEAEGVAPLLAHLPAEVSRAVKEAIVSALTQINDDSVIPGVLPWLDSEDAFLRNNAVDILRKRGGKAVPFLDRAFRSGGADRRKFVIDVLAQLDRSVTAELYELALKDSDINVVIAAVEALGEARRKEFRDRIEQLIQRAGHPMLLCACLESLARISEPASVDYVRQRLGPLETLAPYLLPSALKLFGNAGSEGDIAHITSLIDRPELANSILDALTSLRKRHPGMQLPNSLSALLRSVALKGEPGQRSYEALRLLGAVEQDPQNFEFLKEGLAHREAQFRIGAIESLREGYGNAVAAELRKCALTETEPDVLEVLREADD